MFNFIGKVVALYAASIIAKTLFEAWLVKTHPDEAYQYLETKLGKISRQQIDLINKFHAMGLPYEEEDEDEDDDSEDGYTASVKDMAD